MSKIKKGDKVVVLAGKDKGKQGIILRVFVRESKVLVEGINLVKKAVKPNPQMNEQGGIKSKEAPIHISNVALVHPNTSKPAKVGYKVIDNAKVRVFKSDEQRVDN